jgi:DNA repair exonuclease SbcCD ATPase subunit
MIDFKKISAAAILVSLMGTTASFAMEEDKDRGKISIKAPQVPAAQQPEYNSNDPRFNPSVGSDHSEIEVQADEAEQLLSRLTELYMQKAKSAEEEAEKSQKQLAALEEMKKKLEESEAREREANIKVQGAELERLKQAAEAEKRRAEEAEKHRLEMERLSQEAEKAKQVRQAAEAKRVAAEQSAKKAPTVYDALGQIPIGGKTRDGARVERNLNKIGKDVEKAGKDIGKALKFRKKKKKDH